VLCDALGAAHAVGVVHRDVKPSNMMITSHAPGLKLLDFGISKLYDDTPDDEGRTRTGMVLGTPAYMAPEQIPGGHDITDRADVYAVGILSLLLLTGRPPVDEITRRGALRHSVRSGPDLSTVRGEAPETLVRLIERCLAHDPASRPGARELARELAAFANDAGVPSLDALEREGALCAVSSPDAPLSTLVEAGGARAT
jgi:serine/threonine protein kinase